MTPWDLEEPNDFDASLDRAERFGHHFAQIPVTQRRKTAAASGPALDPGSAPIQLMRPHPHDVGRHFHILWGRGTYPRVGRYLGPGSSEGTYKFLASDQEIELTEDKILGYRPTVGQLHPPGNERSMEDRLSDRSFVMLSGGDLSEAMARQRMDPGLRERMAVTTYEQQPNYQSYGENAENLSRLGVPILNNIDLSQSQSVSRLQTVGPGTHFHFQMPRVPRGTPEYSTQKLVRDTANLPLRLRRDDLSVSITTPDPSSYKKRKGTHDQIYGLKSGQALKGTGMKIEDSESDEDLEEYGYTHKQSTTDQSTEAAKRRRTYTLGRAPIVKVASMKEASGRSWNAGDRFEIEGHPGNYFTVLKSHHGDLPFAKGDLWIHLRGG